MEVGFGNRDFESGIQHEDILEQALEVPDNQDIADNHKVNLILTTFGF